MQWDCHMHMVLDGCDWRAALARHADAPLDSYIHRVLEQYQKAGFTYLRDGGDRWGVGKRARELATQYSITYVTPLAPLCKKGHYGAFIGTAWESLKEYAALVVKTRENGGDFIKIMISGLMDFDRFGVLTEAGLDPREIKELVHIAHSEGMAVMAHANGSDTVLAAAEAGVDSVEHGAYLREDALWAMKEAGTVWVPTISTVANLRNKGRFHEAAVERILENVMENVAFFARFGGSVAPGSDAGAWQVFHAGVTEQALLQQCGVSEAMQEQAARAIQERFQR